MLKTMQAIRNERVVSIKELQKSPSRHLKQFTRILRGNQTLGYFLDEKSFENILEDFEALQSPAYLASIQKARLRKKTYTLKEVEKRYGV